MDVKVGTKIVALNNYPQAAGILEGAVCIVTAVEPTVIVYSEQDKPGETWLVNPEHLLSNFKIIDVEVLQ